MIDGVRPFRREDAEAVAAMCDELKAGGLNRGTAPSLEALRARFLGPDAAGAILVAERGGAAVGCCTLHASHETEFAQHGLYIGDLFVARAHRRQGLGRALVAAAAREARARGGTFLWWTSLPSNARAAAFCAALGAYPEMVRAHVLARDAFDRLAEP
jgi:GNAT superfamily N-acetyltransferase